MAKLISKLPDRDHQGFLTSLNRYVGRKEAWIIAKENNQIVYGLKASEAIDEEKTKVVEVQKQVAKRKLP